MSAVGQTPNAAIDPSEAVVVIKPTDTLKYPVDIVTALTPVFFATLFATFLVGVYVVWLAKFHQNAQKGNESLFDRILIYSITFWLAVAVACQLGFAEWTYGQQWGQPAALGFGPRLSTYGLYVIFGTVVVAHSQSFFALRAWRLNGSHPLFGIALILLIITDLAFAWHVGFSVVVDSVKAEISYHEAIEKAYWSRTAYWSMAAFNDVIICMCICVRLYLAKAHMVTSISTETAIGRILRLSFATSCVTTAWAVTLAILHACNTPRTESWGNLLLAAFPEFYAVTVLFSVNFKHPIRTVLHDSRGSSRGWPSFLRSVHWDPTKSTSKAQAPVKEIQVTMETFQVADQTPDDESEHVVKKAKSVRVQTPPV